MSALPLAPGKPALVERVLMRCPGQCAVCRAWSGQHVCADCLQRYAQAVSRCWTCGLQLPTGLGSWRLRSRPRCGNCLKKPPPLERCIAALDYRFPWDGLLQHYKFHQAIELRETLLERLEQALDAAQAERPDWLLAVPLTPERLRERGYNQSLELARSLARRRKLQCEPQLLLRVRHTAQQASLTLKERAANVKRAFALEPRRAGDLRGAHVALLDDVMTSGETLFEIARILRQAGAAQVQAWVVARTPQAGSD
ncbi:ComF family protein [Paucibacter oligotrophus]|uniref:ComF family protein n=1 Tax=Roseateles oligotrophus TaxID=1769250 RepID=A0A840LC13_9BURK|nr:ComF family protein [Roseateles oligotrophus]MBB4845696.1 ComF family protein [Roseateles oligotrophus]